MQLIFLVWLPFRGCVYILGSIIGADMRDAIMTTCDEMKRYQFVLLKCTWFDSGWIEAGLWLCLWTTGIDLSIRRLNWLTECNLWTWELTKNDYFFPVGIRKRLILSNLIPFYILLTYQVSKSAFLVKSLTVDNSGIYWNVFSSSFCRMDVEISTKLKECSKEANRLPWKFCLLYTRYNSFVHKWELQTFLSERKMRENIFGCDDERNIGDCLQCWIQSSSEEKKDGMNENWQELL